VPGAKLKSTRHPKAVASASTVESIEDTTIDYQDLDKRPWLLTLLQLLCRIVYHSDNEARNELHDNRVLFHHKHKCKYRLAEYIDALRGSALARKWCGHETMVMEAYNLTIDKFFNIPDKTDNDEQARLHGPDCRYYLEACIQYMTQLLNEKSPPNALAAEMIFSEALAGMAERQFRFSCLEAQRKARRFDRRYRWRSPGGDLYVRLPSAVPRQQCRTWLETNIGEVNPQRHGEKERVQAMINRLLAKKQIFLLSELHHIEERLPSITDPLPFMIEEQISVDGLATVVAEEKSENIKQQRPTIRLLGKDKLKELIHAIFTRLADGDYVEKDIACSFGLSAATFCRFAGARWKKDGDDMTANHVPDLWRNTAHTLAGHSDFITAAQKAGVWKRVREILKAEDDRETVR
jgi:hypothetical protein